MRMSRISIIIGWKGFNANSCKKKEVGMWVQWIGYGILSGLVIFIVIALGISPRTRFGPPPPGGDSKEDNLIEATSEGTVE
jgi:hypothetical protein